LHELLRPLGAFLHADGFSPLFGSFVFWGSALSGWALFSLCCLLQSLFFDKPFRRLASLLGYGLIPLVLGGFLAFYVRMFLRESWRLLPNLLDLFGLNMAAGSFELLSPETTATLLHLIILGGLASTLYAVFRIIARLHAPRPKRRHLLLPFLYALLLGVLFLHCI